MSRQLPDPNANPDPLPAGAQDQIRIARQYGLMVSDREILLLGQGRPSRRLSFAQGVGYIIGELVPKVFPETHPDVTLNENYPRPHVHMVRFRLPGSVELSFRIDTEAARTQAWLDSPHGDRRLERTILNRAVTDFVGWLAVARQGYDQTDA